MSAREEMGSSASGAAIVVCGGGEIAVVKEQEGLGKGHGWSSLSSNEQ